MSTNMTMPDVDLDQDVPVVRTADAIASDLRDLPRQVAAWQREIHDARHRVMTALSGIRDDTDLRTLRTQLIDEGLQPAEEAAVAASERAIAQLQADLATLEGAGWKYTLPATEEIKLPSVLPIVAEQAQHMPGDAILQAITGALVRDERVALVAWVIAADRIAARKDLRPAERHAIAGEIAKARRLTGDRSLNATMDTLRSTIEELRAYRRSVIDHVADTDEVTSGPLEVYRFGRSPVDGRHGMRPSRPTPTAAWFRERAGMPPSTGNAS